MIRAIDVELHAVVVLIVVLLTGSELGAHPRTHVTLPYEAQGVVSGAEYTIRVPANWNGTLLVYAHGYTGMTQPPPVAPPIAGLADLLYAQGFALTGSNFEGSGWQVEEAMEDLVALTRFFSHEVGLPDRTLIWGASMGGLITLGLIEKRPQVFDGAVALCAPAEGSALAFDRRLDYAVAYDAAFGWPSAWGPLDNPTYPLDFFAEVLPRMLPNTGPDQFGKWELIRLIAGYPSETFYNAAVHNRFHDMYFATVVRGEFNDQAGGRASQNIDHDYALSDTEKAYLAGLGVDAEAMLAAMNERRIYVADHDARRWAERWVTPEGDLDRPVITVHNIRDGLVSVQSQGLYAATVAAEHDSDLLVQTYVNDLGHCAFTPTQVLMAMAAMGSWLDTGVAPDASFFPVEEGFNPSYVPPPWPFEVDIDHCRR